MLRSWVYIPEDLNKKIKRIARLKKESKAAVIREALRYGVDYAGREKGESVDSLLELARLGEKYKLKGPRDLSANLDKYAWGAKD